MLTRSSLTIRLHPADDVVIARQQLIGGTTLLDENVTVSGLVPPGHKVATRAVPAGSPVRRYNQIIGFASRDIAPGEHVHLHNLAMGTFDRDYAFGVDAKPTRVHRSAGDVHGHRAPRGPNAGKVATRNYIGILSTVNCSATVARGIADHFTRERARGVSERRRRRRADARLGLRHGYAGRGDADPAPHARRLCEAREFRRRADRRPRLRGEPDQRAARRRRTCRRAPLLRTFSIQDTGGTAKTIAHGIVDDRRDAAACERRARASRCPASHLTVGLQCGGSDGYSGITANPALGAAVDLLVRHGGTAILSETPEIYGAEHLLTRRAVSREIGEKLVARIRWWEDYTARERGEMNNNPSPGNKAGGLTTILEKSLGAVAKGGTTNLVEVYEYAEPVTAKGFVYMDTPGYDPVSATGQVAGGANMIVFTTGRGSAYGCAPSPSLKLSTNTALWVRQEEDIDLNCGEIVDGDATVGEIGERLFRMMLDDGVGREDEERAAWLRPERIRAVVRGCGDVTRGRVLG